MNDIHKTTKFVFEIVGAMLLAMLLYQVFFGKDNSALRYACEQVEKPISFYYYQYSFYPSAHNLDGISISLRPSQIKIFDVTNLDTNSCTDTLHNTDNVSSCANYTTGWK